MSTIEQGTVGGLPEAAAQEEGTPAAEPAKKQSTDYRVLTKDGNGWIEADVYTAASGKAAISAHVKAKDLKEGTFVAVPLRSWAPLMLKVETTTKVNLA